MDFQIHAAQMKNGEQSTLTRAVSMSVVMSGTHVLFEWDAYPAQATQFVIESCGESQIVDGDDLHLMCDETLAPLIQRVASNWHDERDGAWGMQRIRGIEGVHHILEGLEIRETNEKQPNTVKQEEPLPTRVEKQFLAPCEVKITRCFSIKKPSTSNKQKGASPSNTKELDTHELEAHGRIPRASRLAEWRLENVCEPMSISHLQDVSHEPQPHASLMMQMTEHEFRQHMYACGINFWRSRFCKRLKTLCQKASTFGLGHEASKVQAIINNMFTSPRAYNAQKANQTVKSVEERVKAAAKRKRSNVDLY